MTNPTSKWQLDVPEEEFAQEIQQRADEAYSSAKVKQPDYDKTITALTVERQKSEQDFRWQIVSFRRGLLWYLLILMTFETIALFVIIILASLPSRMLIIEDVTLQVLVGATIAQISAMLIVIIRSVYSNSLNKLIMSDKGLPPVK